MPNNRMESIWEKEQNFEEREALKGDIKVDAAIIGGGMAGLLTAYFLQQKGLKTVVLEAQTIAGGQTKNTTAKITSQHGLIYDNLIQNFGAEKALLYANANEEAIKQYEALVKERGIECHFEKKPAYLYTLKDSRVIEKEAEAAEKCGISAEFTMNTALPFEVKGAVKFENQAQFHPLEFLKEIINPLTIYEHTQAKAINDSIILTEQGRVKAEHIVVASHYPFINTPGYYFLRMHQERSYVMALKNAGSLDGMYRDESKEGLSFRTHKDMLLLGGGGHRTGENTPGSGYGMLKEAAAKYYIEHELVCRWSAQDCHTIDSVPYIGKYSPSTPNLYVATGFKKWGMTGSMVSAGILSDMITGVKNPYEDLFSPHRFQVSASMVSLLDETRHVASGLLIDKLKPAKKHLDTISNGQGAIIEEDGQKMGVYKEQDGKTHCVSITCSHLGCQLAWNGEELTWDCPCHGSRFTYTGELIDNPALEDIHYEEV